MVRLRLIARRVSPDAPQSTYASSNRREMLELRACLSAEPLLPLVYHLVDCNNISYLRNIISSVTSA